jgi:hypothetical protein
MSMPRLLLDAASIDGQPVEGIRAGDFSAQATLDRSSQVVQVEVGSQEAEATLVDAQTGDPVNGVAFFHRQSLRSMKDASTGEADALDAPMDFRHGFRWETWNPSAPLVRRRLPAHIFELRMTFRKKREPMIVPINPGAHTRVEVPVELPEGVVTGTPPPRRR